MIKKELVVGTSLAERPIAMLVQTAGRFNSELHLQMDNKNINLKSIMGVISIGSLIGHTVTISANGNDQDEALAAVVEYLS